MVTYGQMQVKTTSLVELNECPKETHEFIIKLKLTTKDNFKNKVDMFVLVV